MKTISNTVEKKILDTYDAIIGLDEVGRGPIAGPLTIASFILDKNNIDKLDNTVNDSKKIPKTKHHEIVQYIKKTTPNHSEICHTQANVIDAYGMAYSLKIAFQTTLSQTLNLAKTLQHKKVLVIIDGNPLNTIKPGTYPNLLDMDITIQYQTKADATFICVAAASLIAKTTRDAIMTNLDPENKYNFKNNAGYGTKEHYNAIEKYGILPNIHRKTFIKK